MNSIIEAVAKNQYLKPEDLKSSDRHRDIVLARDMAIYLILQRDSLTFTEVGRAFNRTPATTSYAYQKIARNMHINPSFKAMIIKIAKQISPLNNSPFLEKKRIEVIDKNRIDKKT